VRRFHLIIGVLGLVVFALTGHVMLRHAPPASHLNPELRLMYVSRHIYLLGAALVNLMTGLYLQMAPAGWRRAFQFIGSALVFLSPVLLALAFFAEGGGMLGGVAQGGEFGETARAGEAEGGFPALAEGGLVAEEGGGDEVGEGEFHGGGLYALCGGVHGRRCGANAHAV